MSLVCHLKYLVTLLLLIGGLSSYADSRNEGGARKAPFRILYDNDMTNIVGCPSPYHPKEEGYQFTEKMLRASIDETAGTGIDVHVLQPGLGWIPYWKSKVLPMSDHIKYIESTGAKPGSFESFVAQGGDIVKIFVEECRAKGLVPFISLRMNDAHHIRRGLSASKDPAEQTKAMAEFQYFADHPEFRLGSDSPEVPYQNLTDWGHPEVRQYKFSFLKELCENYDIDGLELDFMRHPIFFKKHLPVKDRVEIMTGFIKQVRNLLDRTSKKGQHRWLCVHIPGYLDEYNNLGVDLKSWAEAGIDMVNVSGYFFNNQQMEIEEIRRQLPVNVAIYEEVHFTTATRQPPGEKFTLRRATDQQLYTTANLAYARGADGMSTFNFQYYRGTINPDDVYGNAFEPPFHVFKHLADRDWLRSQPQDYFTSIIWGKSRPGRLINSPLKAGMNQTVVLDMVPPSGGWKKAGRLRVQAFNSLKNTRFTIEFNGTTLESNNDVSEPYPNPYEVALGKPEDYQAWSIPTSIIKNGVNYVNITLTEGDPAQIFFLEASLP